MDDYERQGLWCSDTLALISSDALKNMMFFEAAEMVELFKENMDEASAALVVWSAQLPTLPRKTNNIKKTQDCDHA